MRKGKYKKSHHGDRKLTNVKHSTISFLTVLISYKEHVGVDREAWFGPLETEMLFYLSD